MQFGSQTITPFLTFFGQAEEAMKFYCSLFDRSEILNVVYHPDGKVLHAVFNLKGQKYMCIDSMQKHDWTFTPAISLFVDCDSEDELQKLFEALSENGKVHMPLGDYGFSKMFAWVDDRYGVSWQLNLA